MVETTQKVLYSYLLLLCVINTFPDFCDTVLNCVLYHLSLIYFVSAGFPSSWSHFFKRFYLFIFIEMGREKKTERETSMCGCLLCTPYWGSGLPPNRTCYSLVCRTMVNPLSYTSQGLFSLFNYSFLQRSLLFSSTVITH